MKFKYSYGKVSKEIRLEQGTVLDLREIISQELDLKKFDILDLGRIMSDDEILSELNRNVFTIMVYNSSKYG